ncbi:MAG: GxxExxY protein [Gemmatimonadota bacterium]|nr:GxxExxY protein [Gemmatimonadota bacterium]
MPSDSERKLLYAGVTDKIIGGFYAVYNAHGYGFLESVYRRSMRLCLERQGISVQAEAPYPVTFLGEEVGMYRADLVVSQCIIVECKSVEHLVAAHEAQLMNYLKASGLAVGLLLNFGPRPMFRRMARSHSPDPP